MVGPSEISWNLGLLAALAMVVFGSLATVQTRALAGENTTVLMVFYTVGLTVFTALPALWAWQPVANSDWPLLLAIGVLAQIGQYCYLRAYQSSPANRLAPFHYLSIVLASLAGFLAFGEVPAPTTFAGIAIIIAPGSTGAARQSPNRKTPGRCDRGLFAAGGRGLGGSRQGGVREPVWVTNLSPYVWPAGSDWP
jgi:drug/metabolite transporter (DMT)-like permease